MSCPEGYTLKTRPILVGYRFPDNTILYGTSYSVSSAYQYNFCFPNPPGGCLFQTFDTPITVAVDSGVITDYQLDFNSDLGEPFHSDTISASGISEPTFIEFSCVLNTEDPENPFTEVTLVHSAGSSVTFQASCPSYVTMVVTPITNDFCRYTIPGSDDVLVRKEFEVDCTEYPFQLICRFTVGNYFWDTPNLGSCPIPEEYYEDQQYCLKCNGRDVGPLPPPPGPNTPSPYDCDISQHPIVFREKQDFVEYRMSSLPVRGNRPDGSGGTIYYRLVFETPENSPDYYSDFSIVVDIGGFKYCKRSRASTWMQQYILGDGFYEAWSAEYAAAFPPGPEGNIFLPDRAVCGEYSATDKNCTVYGFNFSWTTLQYSEQIITQAEYEAIDPSETQAWLTYYISTGIIEYLPICTDYECKDWGGDPPPRPDFPAIPLEPALPPPVEPPVFPTDPNPCRGVMILLTLLWVDTNKIIQDYKNNLVLTPGQPNLNWPAEMLPYILDIQNDFGQSGSLLEFLQSPAFTKFLYDRLLQLLSGVVPEPAGAQLRNFLRYFSPQPLWHIGCSKCEGEVFVEFRRNSPDPTSVNHWFGSWYLVCGDRTNETFITNKFGQIISILNQGILYEFP